MKDRALTIQKSPSQKRIQVRMNKSSQPTVSICIPAYNSEKYIGKTIQSALSQTYQDFELVIVDDCSTDRTLNTIKEYKDPRIRLIENEKNLGPEKNWNKALAEAKGKYIKLLHHDDLLSDSCLERQVAILKNPAHKDVLLVCCSRYIIDENDNIILKRGFKNKNGKFPGHRIIKEAIRSGANLIGEPTAVLFRADILNQVGNFNGSIPYLIDMELWCRMLLHGKIYIISDPLCTFRVSSTSLSMAIGSSQGRDFKAFADKVYKNKDYRLTWYDCALSKFRGYLNGVLRYLFYKFVLRRKKTKRF